MIITHGESLSLIKIVDLNALLGKRGDKKLKAV